MEILYKEVYVGTRSVDFFVEGIVMVEIKAIEKIEGLHKAQAINYCEAFNIAVAYLSTLGQKNYSTTENSIKN